MTDHQGQILNKNLMVIRMQNLYNKRMQQNKKSRLASQLEARQKLERKLHPEGLRTKLKAESETMNKVQLSNEDQVKESICWLQEQLIYFSREFEINKGVLHPLVKKVIMHTGVDEVFIPLKHKYFGVRNRQYEDESTWYKLRSQKQKEQQKRHTLKAVQDQNIIKVSFSQASRGSTAFDLQGSPDSRRPAALMARTGAPFGSLASKYK